MGRSCSVLGTFGRFSSSTTQQGRRARVQRVSPLWIGLASGNSSEGQNAGGFLGSKLGAGNHDGLGVFLGKLERPSRTRPIRDAPPVGWPDRGTLVPSTLNSGRSRQSTA